MRTESADYREGFAAGRDDARAQMDALYDQNYQLESELNQLRARAQRLEAALVLTEDQRDAARKERDDWLAALKREQSKHLETLHAAIAERDAAIARVGVLRAELHYERQQHASTREILRAMERGNT